MEPYSAFVMWFEHSPVEVALMMSPVRSLRATSVRSLERRMLDVNREGFTNQFEDDSRFAEGRRHAASLVETRA
jgi:hypothetical protein